MFHLRLVINHQIPMLLCRWCWQLPRTPCMCSFGAGAGRCSPLRTPCMCSFRAGAGRCSRPRTPCKCSFGAGAGRCSPPRTPCMCSFGAGAGTSTVASLLPHRPPSGLCPYRGCQGSSVPSWGHLCLPSPPPLHRRAAASWPPRHPPQAPLARVACSQLHRSSISQPFLASCGHF